MKEKLKLKEEKKRNKGISLIVLVITIIVIIILATAVILTLNQSGITNRAEEAAVLTEIGNIEDTGRLIYLEMITLKYTENGEEPSKEKLISELIKKGYKIEEIAGGKITGIKVDKEEVKMGKGETERIEVTKETGEGTNEYYAKIRGKYYKIIYENGIKVERTATNIGEAESEEITAEVTRGTVVTIEVNGKEIKIQAGEETGEAEITIKCGEAEKVCKVKVESGVLKPSEDATATNTEPSFSTDYGRIEVIWLDTNNNVKDTPNEPNLYSGENALKPVTWTKSGTTWTEDATAKTNWYNYSAIDGLGDNTTSMWANAKNSDGSYFVWIPRYAYRITYYENDTSTTPLGYYDGDGMWDSSDATVSYELDAGIETVKYNGYKYIVHPAFETNLDNGGWDKDLEGFWTAKYEMSRTDATVSSAGSGTIFKSKPSVQSARSISIGDMYQYSRSYDAAKESHMIKNSEWGAVAYLTQSKYGRNGHEIYINNSSGYVTGNGGGSPTASSLGGITNEYNTEIGGKASTTGNVYGVYDMSGGAYEYTAGYDEKGNSYLTDASRGLNMTKEAKNASGEYISTKYVTKYTNGTGDNRSVTKIREVSKIGDGIKEVRRKSDIYGWYSNYSYVVYSSGPFTCRGGGYNFSTIAGVFYAQYNGGASNSYNSFRVCLGL